MIQKRYKLIWLLVVWIALFMLYSCEDKKQKKLKQPVTEEYGLSFDKLAKI